MHACRVFSLYSSWTVGWTLGSSPPPGQVTTGLSPPSLGCSSTTSVQGDCPRVWILPVHRDGEGQPTLSCGHPNHGEKAALEGRGPPHGKEALGRGFECLPAPTY